MCLHLVDSHACNKFFGVEAIICACHLINKMPSSVLHDRIPISFMYPDKPTLSVVPLVFGSTCVLFRILNLD